MNVLNNHCWCSKSNWDNKSYECKYIVWIEMHKDSANEISPDWSNLVQKTDDIPALNDEVLQWLQNNVADQTSKDLKGWCVGSDEYNAAALVSISIFFQRKKDVLAFIKRWSIHKKPLFYYNYFKGEKKRLNLKTGKLEVVSE